MSSLCVFFFNDTATTEIYTLSLHDALPIYVRPARRPVAQQCAVHALGHQAHLQRRAAPEVHRSEEHTSELQSPCNLVCRLLLEKKKLSNSDYAKLHFGEPVSYYDARTRQLS